MSFQNTTGQQFQATNPYYYSSAPAQQSNVSYVPQPHYEGNQVQPAFGQYSIPYATPTQLPFAPTAFNQQPFPAVATAQQPFSQHSLPPTAFNQQHFPAQQPFTSFPQQSLPFVDSVQQPTVPALNATPCSKHPQVMAVDTCSSCKKALCVECKIMTEGENPRVICEDCKPKKKKSKYWYLWIVFGILLIIVPTAIVLPILLTVKK